MSDEHLRRLASVLGGPALDPEPDPLLHELARDAARAVGAPMAMVVLVLARTQIFRGHHGLPDDLARIGGTDRDVSLCQFVVRDGRPLSVADLSLEPDLPQALARTFGLRSYLGVPVSLEGIAVGSVCVVDRIVRTFSPSDVKALEVLAGRASARLAQLSGSSHSVDERLLSRAVQPVFGELRNLLFPLGNGLTQARVAAADLAPIRRLAEAISDGTYGDPPPIAELVVRASGALDDLTEILADLEHVSARLQRQVLALERVVAQADEPHDLTDAVPSAVSLAHHLTKIAGGVRIPVALPTARLRGPRTALVAALGAILADLARGGGTAGVDVTVTELAGAAEITCVTPGVEPEQATRCVTEVGELLGDGPFLRVEARGAAVVLRVLLD